MWYYNPWTPYPLQAPMQELEISGLELQVGDEVIGTKDLHHEWDTYWNQRVVVSIELGKVMATYNDSGGVSHFTNTTDSNFTYRVLRPYARAMPARICTCGIPIPAPLAHFRHLCKS